MIIDSIFFLQQANKMRNLAELYKNLSPDEREKYEKKSKEAHNDYNKHKMEYLWVAFS